MTNNTDLVRKAFIKFCKKRYGITPDLNKPNELIPQRLEFQRTFYGIYKDFETFNDSLTKEPNWNSHHVLKDPIDQGQLLLNTYGLIQIQVDLKHTAYFLTRF